MSIQNQLSYSLGLKTQEGNKVLAKAIAGSKDHDKLDELIEFIETKPHERLQMDAMLTIAYISEQVPNMVIDKVDFLLGKLDDPINRVVFASMIALANASELFLDKLYNDLPKILDAMDSGTVVTRDFGFRILVQLYEKKEYAADVFHIISNQLVVAPPNQLGQYVERLIPAIGDEHKKDLITILENWQTDLSSDSHLKRLNKNLNKLYK